MIAKLILAGFFLLVIKAFLGPVKSTEDIIEEAKNKTPDDEKSATQIKKKQDRDIYEHQQAIKQRLTQLKATHPDKFTPVTAEDAALLKDIYHIKVVDADVFSLTGLYNKIIYTHHYKSFPTSTTCYYLDDYQIEIPVEDALKVGKTYTVSGVYVNDAFYVLSVLSPQSPAKQSKRKSEYPPSDVGVTEPMANSHRQAIQSVKKVKKINALETTRQQTFVEQDLIKLFMLIAIFPITIVISLCLAVGAITECVVILLSLMAMIALVIVMKRKQLPIYKITGLLTKQDNNPRFADIDGVRVFSEYEWFRHYADGAWVEAEGYKETRGNISLDLVRLGEHSIGNENHRFNFKKVIYYGVVVAWYGLLLAILWHLSSYEYYRNDLEKRDIQSVFHNYHEIYHYDTFFTNQYVTFKDVYYIERNTLPGEIYILRGPIPHNQQQALNKIDDKVNQLQAFIDDVRHGNDLSAYTDNKDYRYFSEFQALMTAWRQHQGDFSAIEYELELFCDAYLNAINYQIDDLKTTIVKQYSTNVIVDIGYRHVDSWGYRYVSEGQTIIKPHGEPPIYGQHGTFKGDIQHVAFDHGRVHIKLNERGTVDYLLAGQLYSLVRYFYLAIIVVTLLLLAGELVKIRFGWRASDNP